MAIFIDTWVLFADRDMVCLVFGCVITIYQQLHAAGNTFLLPGRDLAQTGAFRKGGVGV
jgi:hypothetical protein